jgi:hypothetical protein
MPGACLYLRMWERVDTILRALRIVSSAGGAVGVDHFSRQFWPNAANWDRQPTRQLKAGAGFLGRLRGGGYLTRCTRGVYAINDTGRAFLACGGAPNSAAPGPPNAPKTAPAASPAPHTTPATYVAPGAPVHVLWTDGRRYPAVAVSSSAAGVVVTFRDGSTYMVGARSVVGE